MNELIKNRLERLLSTVKTDNVKVKEAMGLAYKDEEFWPEIMQSNNAILDVYGLVKCRVYKTNSWAIYQLKTLEINIENLMEPGENCD